jgi:ABC-type nitrate/sulfonate/bicarbonate transport system substrate-binding protein
MGGTSARYASPISGAVDATVLSLPFNLQAEKAGYKDLLWLGERFELPLSGLGVRDETIQKNPKQVLGLIRAVFRAMAFANGHPEKTMQMLRNWGCASIRKSRPKAMNWVNAAGRRVALSRMQPLNYSWISLSWSLKPKKP